VDKRLSKGLPADDFILFIHYYNTLVKRLTNNTKKRPAPVSMAGELESLLGGIFWNDDGDDIPSDSREILKYNYLTGKLYVDLNAKEIFIFGFSPSLLCVRTGLLYAMKAQYDMRMLKKVY
jgi:hypothetical protein